MVYVATEYKYLKSQEYEKEKANPKVRLAVPNLKDDCLKRQQVREAFARFFCKAYVPEVPPLPECCIKKALEYKPTKSLKKKDFQILLILRVMRMIMWSSATYENISTVVKRQRKLVMLW